MKINEKYGSGGGVGIQIQNFVAIKINCFSHSNVPNTTLRRQSTQSEKRVSIWGISLFVCKISFKAVCQEFFLENSFFFVFKPHH